MKTINPGYVLARLRAQRYDHPKLLYPSIERKDKGQPFQDILNEDWMLTDPVKPRATRMSFWDKALLTCVSLTALGMLLTGGQL